MSRERLFCGWWRWFRGSGACNWQIPIKAVLIGGWLVRLFGVGLAGQRSLSGNVQKETNGQLMWDPKLDAVYLGYAERDKE